MSKTISNASKDGLMAGGLSAIDIERLMAKEKEFKSGKLDIMTKKGPIFKKGGKL